MSDTVWICPVCGQPLAETGSSLQCGKHHNFDRSKKGAVYLLPPNKKHSGLPGDNPDMVRARRDFLSKGYYAHLKDTLTEAVKPFLHKNAVLLDAGCGEGYYTSGIHAAFPQAAVYGVDISKTAANYAAKADPSGHYAVASVFHLPVADNVCDVVMSIFAPYCGGEFQRVLKSDGMFIMAIPAEKHLWELKTAVYDHPYENAVRDYALDGFSFIQKLETSQTIHLDSVADVRALFGMTPYAYRTGAKERERLAALAELSVQTAFEVLVYQKL